VAAVRGEPLPPGDLDFPALLAAAEAHGVLPLLARSGVVRTLPPEWQRRLGVLSIAHTARSQRALGTLARLVAAFRAAALPLVCWKGPLLADQLYGDPSLRAFTDLDVIVAPRETERAEALLEDLGYRPQSRLTRSQRATLRRFGSERLFLDAEGQTAIDLHWRFGNAGFPLPLEFDDAWARHVEWDVAGVRYPTLGPVDLVVTATAHGAKHLWHKLELLATAARLGERALDWDAVDALAGDLHLQRALGLAFLLAESVLGSPPPPVPRALSAARAVFPAVRNLVEENLFSARAVQRDAGPRQLWLLADRRRDVARAVAAALFVPTHADWQAAALPGWAYWLLRPARLLGRSLARSGRRITS
jgi:hypothetical protein